MSAQCIQAVLIWAAGEVIAREIAADRLVAAVEDPDTLVWVDLVNPTQEDLTRLVSELGLSPRSVEDAMAPHERPKVTRHAGHLFFQTYATTLDLPTPRGPEDADAMATDLAARSAATRGGRLSLSRVSGYVLPRALVTVRLDDKFDMLEVVRRWEQDYDLTAHAVGALVHGLLDVIVDGHFDTIQQIDDAIEELESILFEDRLAGRDFLQVVYGVRKNLVQLRRVVLPMREVVNGLLRHRLSGQAELDAEYSDLYDHVLRAAEWTESLRDMVTTLFETHLSLTDNHLNTVMKKLASWAAIIAVPTAITGWFGQNVPYPGFSQTTGLWMSVVLIIVLSAGLFAAFKSRDWL
ncbi:MAG: magnesium transporter CorA family protein [Micrococcales bacterium]|nr:magnesium transporter CorA family protein [Micrococcales bacterium]